MKKKILLIFILAIFGFAKANAANAVLISGHITNSLTGTPVPYHAVYITDSMSYQKAVYTDYSGYYQDSSWNSSSNPTTYYIRTLDCNNVSHYNAVISSSNIMNTVNYSICYNGVDIGVVDILNPTDTIINNGITIYPQVVIKNYDTIPISNATIRYSVNGQYAGWGNWSGNPLLHDSTVVCTLIGFTPPSTSFTFCANTNSSNDYNPYNDSLCMNVIQTSPATDAGVTDIITSINPIQAGDTITLFVKLKNYGTQTITSLQMGYRINWLTYSPINWVGSLMHDSIALVQIGQYVVPNTVNIDLVAYTNLNGDMNHFNDTCYKTFTINYSQIDVGVTNIIIPGDTSYFAGNYIYPKIRIKNYDTMSLSSFPVAYSFNGQAPVNETWTGSPLAAGATFDYIFSTGFILPNTNFNICAYTLNNDNYPSNDTLCKNVIAASPLIDAGLISINFPVNSITVGDSIAPVIQFKNFGTDTLHNMQINYVINGQLFVTENWIGNLPHNNTATYTFLHKFAASSAGNLYLFVKLILSGDNNHTNDSIYKIINVNPAQIDVGVLEIISPANVTCSGMQTYPKVVIKNFGITPLTSIPLSCQRGSSTIVTGNWTRLIPLNYGDTVHFTFATFFNVPIGTSYAFTAYTTLTNDANPINNKVSKSVLIGSPPPTSFNIIGDDTVIIGQSNVAYHADYFAYNSDQYIWTLPPGAVIDTVYNNYIVINYGNNAQSGNFTCKIMNSCGITQTVVLPISVFASPPPPIIYQSGNTLYSGYSTGNQWYFNNVAISGATQPTYIPANTGYYYCMVTINGSVSYASNSIYVALTGIDDAFIKSHFNVYPNPFTDKTNFNYSLNKSALVNLKITDMEGRLIRTLVNEEQSIGEFSYQLNANNLSKGIYFYQFKAGNTSLNGKLIITE